MSLPIPMANRLIVEPLPQKEERVGKIIIPVTANVELEAGRIVAISKEFPEDMLKEGEVVLYPSGSGTPMLIDKITYKWLQGPVLGQLGEIWGTDTERYNEEVAAEVPKIRKK